MDDVFTNKLMAYPINRNIFKTNKYTLTLFIPPVETVYYTNKYQVNPNSVLYLAMPWKAGMDTTGKSFKITIANRKRVLQVIKTALEWFEELTDLFVTAQNGVLYFNNDYNNLKSIYNHKYYETPQAIKIVPSAIEVGQGVMAEGVVFYMNKLENYLLLTKEELQELYDVLEEFDFASQTILTYKALEMSAMTNQMTSYQQWADRMRG